MSGEGNTDYEEGSEFARVLKSLAEVSPETLTKLGAHLSSTHPPVEPVEPLARFKNDRDSYVKDNIEDINIDGIPVTAHKMGLEDVKILTDIVERYVHHQRRMLKETIIKRFRVLRQANELVITPEDVAKNAAEQVEGSNQRQKDSNQSTKSQENRRLVDLLEVNEVEVVVRMSGRTCKQLYFAVENYRAFLTSLENKVSVERAKEEKNKPSSSSQPKKKAGKTKSGKKKK